MPNPSEWQDPTREQLHEWLTTLLENFEIDLREDDWTWAGQAYDFYECAEPIEEYIFVGHRSDKRPIHMPGMAAWMRANRKSVQ